MISQFILIVRYLRTWIRKGVILQDNKNYTFAVAITTYRDLVCSDRRSFSTNFIRMEKLKIAVIGKKNFYITFYYQKSEFHLSHVFLIVNRILYVNIGQSQFAAEVYKRVVQNGHEVVGVFTIPDDKNGREDALAAFAAQDGVPVFKNKVRRLECFNYFIVF